MFTAALALGLAKLFWTARFNISAVRGPSFLGWIHPAAARPRRRETSTDTNQAGGRSWVLTARSQQEETADDRSMRSLHIYVRPLPITSSAADYLRTVPGRRTTRSAEV